MDIIDFILKKDYDGLKCKLQKKDEDINSLSPSGNTFLITAIVRDFEEGAILLIENGINISILNKNKDSALAVAVEYNVFDVAKLIIEKDKELINIPDLNGNTPLWVAIICALKEVNIDYRMIDLLIKNGADLFHKNNKNQTYLYLIERRQRLEVIDHIKTMFPDKL